MITEKMLIAAAEEVSEAIAVSVPEEPHVFSGEFEKKLRRLIRRAEHPILHQVRRCAVAAVLALILAFGAVCAVSPTARAAVVGWIKNVINHDIRYSTDATSPADVQHNYCFTAEDGYVLLTTIDKKSGTTYIYRAPDGTMMTFLYVHESFSVLNLYDVTHYSTKHGMVGEYIADIYIAPTAEETSIIVWENTDENVLFCIAAAVDADILIQYANSVKKR